MESFIDTLRHNLTVYPFSKIEIEILVALFQQKQVNAHDLRVIPALKKSGPQLYRALTRLLKDQWIIRFSENPSVYSLVSKEAFQKKLDAIILESQNHYTEQKNRFYQIIETFKALESGGSKSKDKPAFLMNISPKTPEFIRKWLEKTVAGSEWRFIKLEPNLVIVIPKDKIEPADDGSHPENVSFKLNSAQWEFSEKKGCYGGVIFCNCESKEMLNELLSRIHDYNVDQIEVGLKMEKKGFIDERKRKITQIAFEKQIPKKPNYSLYTVEFDGTTLKGVVQSKLLVLEGWCVTIWADDTELLKSIEKNVDKIK